MDVEESNENSMTLKEEIIRMIVIEMFIYHFLEWLSFDRDSYMMHHHLPMVDYHTLEYSGEFVLKTFQNMFITRNVPLRVSLTIRIRMFLLIG